MQPCQGVSEPTKALTRHTAIGHQMGEGDALDAFNCHGRAIRSGVFLDRQQRWEEVVDILWDVAKIVNLAFQPSRRACFDNGVTNHAHNVEVARLDTATAASGTLCAGGVAHNCPIVL